MSPNKYIRNARLALNLSEKDAAAQAKLTIYELGDLEARADEFASAIPIQDAFRLCSVLGLSIYEVLGIDAERSPTPLSQGAYVEAIRKEAELTSFDLDEQIGYEVGFIDRVESGAVDLLAYPIELALEIARCTKSSKFQIISALEQVFKKM